MAKSPIKTSTKSDNDADTAAKADEPFVVMYRHVRRPNLRINLSQPAPNDYLKLVKGAAIVTDPELDELIQNVLKAAPIPGLARLDVADMEAAQKMANAMQGETRPQAHSGMGTTAQELSKTSHLLQQATHQNLAQVAAATSASVEPEGGLLPTTEGGAPVRNSEGFIPEASE